MRTVHTPVAVRRVAAELLSWVLGGERLSRDERSRVIADAEVSGVRAAVFGALLRRHMRHGIENGPAFILAPALDGLFRIALPAQDAAIGWTILERGAFEPHVVSLYRQVLRRGMIVVDVGANVGFHALHSAMLVGQEGKVFAVEPDPVNAAALRLSLSFVAAGAGHMELLEAALSDAPGELVLTDLGNETNSGARFTARDRSLLEEFIHGPNPRFRTVRAIRWDDEHIDVPIDFVKIDIEGFEPHALRGMERSIAAHAPRILTELAPSNLKNIGGVDARDYLGWLAARGYSFDVVDDAGLHLVGIDAALAAIGPRHHIDLFCRPAHAR